MSTFLGVRRCLVAAFPVAVAAALSLTSIAGVASAQPAEPSGTTAVSGPVTHPGDDHMGSTIRAHESPALNDGMVTASAMSATSAAAISQPLGMDVSNYQGHVDWDRAVANNAKFVYLKATEGTGYIDQYFTTGYSRSYNAGLFRGAYHFALPDRSSGAAQANFFVNNGGGWSADGHTLPPMLDIEYNPYGATCYGMSGSQMSTWIRDFSNTVRARTGRYPTIYTTRGWWNQCTGSNATFGTNPLFVACYCSSPGIMPAGWEFQTIWQYDDKGIFPGDQDVFNGSMDQLRRFVTVGDGTVVPQPAPSPTPTPTPPAASVAARVDVLPGSAEVGGVIGAMISGWAPNTAVSVTLDGAGRASTVTTDGAGSAMAVLNLPAGTTVGTHALHASTGSTSVSGSFQATPPALFSLYQVFSAILRVLFGL